MVWSRFGRPVVVLSVCHQLMETHDRGLLDDWMANWSDLIDFEVHPVTT